MVSQLDVETAQHVNIHYDKANISTRIFAFLIDLVIIAIYIIGAMLLLSKFKAHRGFFSVLNLIIIIPAIFYHLLMEFLWEGQSVGKKLLSIKAIRVDGSAPVLGDFILRWLFRLVDITLTSGALAVITILFNGKGQRLGDIAAGTAVVNTNAKTSFTDAVQIEIDENYEVHFRKVSVLDDEDIRVIQTVLSSREKYEIQTYAKMVKKTRENIEQKTGIRPEPNLTSLDFLKTVIKDYVAIYG